MKQSFGLERERQRVGAWLLAKPCGVWPRTSQVSKPKLHLAGNSNPICNNVGFFKWKTSTSLLGYTAASFAIQLLGDLICIGIESISDLFRVSLYFCLFFFSYVNIDCSSHPQSEAQSWKIHVTSFQRELLRMHAVSLNALSQNNKSQLDHCSLCVVQSA